MVDIIDQKDFTIMIALESNPLMSTKDLAKIINVSWPTTKKRFSAISEKGIIRKPLAIYHPEKLGLCRISVIVKPTDYTLLIKFEEVIDEYPYVHYRARIVGTDIRLFLQFDIPSNEIAKENLIYFLDKMIEIKIVDNYHFLESSATRFEIYAQLSKFDLDTLSWDFSWKDWFKQIDSFPTTYSFNTIESDDFENFTPLRFEILKILSGNAGIKQADLMPLLNLSRTEAHRHYNYVLNSLIREIRINYNRDYFELTETYLVVLETRSNLEQGKLFNAIKDNAPPFRFAIDILTDGKVILWGNMSSKHINEFLLNLWKRFTNLHIYRLQDGDSSAAIYRFHPPNFDFTKMEWRTSKEYMVDEPLEFLKK